MVSADMTIRSLRNVVQALVTTNISRIILSQTINSLNLHEYAKMNPYEKELHIDDVGSSACDDRL